MDFKYLNIYLHGGIYYDVGFFCKYDMKNIVNMMDYFWISSLYNYHSHLRFALMCCCFHQEGFLEMIMMSILCEYAR